MDDLKAPTWLVDLGRIVAWWPMSIVDGPIRETWIVICDRCSVRLAEAWSSYSESYADRNTPPTVGLRPRTQGTGQKVPTSALTGQLVDGSPADGSAYRVGCKCGDHVISEARLRLEIDTAKLYRRSTIKLRPSQLLRR